MAWNWLFPDNKNNKKLLQEGVGESKKKTPKINPQRKKRES